MDINGYRADRGLSRDQVLNKLANRWPSFKVLLKAPGWCSDGLVVVETASQGSSLFDQLTKLKRIQRALWKLEAEITIYNTDAPEPIDLILNITASPQNVHTNLP